MSTSASTLYVIDACTIIDARSTLQRLAHYTVTEVLSTFLTMPTCRTTA